MSETTIKLIFANAMRLIDELFLEAVSLTAKEFKIDSTLKDYKSLIESLRLVPGLVIMKER